MRWLKLVPSIILLVSVTDCIAAESVQVSVPRMLGLQSGKPRTSLNGPKDTRSVNAKSEHTRIGETQGRLKIGLNFTSSTLFVNSGFIPPDTMGGVGPSHIVELINGRYAVYQKDDGVLIQTSSLDQFWRNAGVSFSGFTFDPRLLYDPFAQRWFALSVDNAARDNQFLLAVSKSSDPTGGWTGFAIDSDSTNLRWADYPTLGFNRDGVFLSANMFSIAGRGAAGLRNTIVAIPKNDLVADTPTIANATMFENNSTDSFNGTGFSVQPIVDLDNRGLPSVLLSSPLSTLFPSFFTRSEITGDIISPSLDASASLISVTPFSGSFSANQPGPKQNVEIANGSIFHANVIKQNGSLWGVQTVSHQGRSALRWFQIDAENDVLLQEGLIADIDLNFFYGSIAVNKFDDVVIGFSGSSELQFISAYGAAGKTIAGITRFDDPVQIKAGSAAYFQDFGSGRNRWGDYSATVIDPADPFAFWTFQEFVSREDRWSTQITQLLLPLPEIANRFVSFAPVSSSFKTTADTSGCPAGFVGTFSFNARLTGKSSSPSLSHLMVNVGTLTNGNLLQNADFGPAEVGATLTISKTGNYSDGVLSPSEFVDVPFSICLKNRKPFNFLVDVFGIETGNGINSLVQR